MTTELMVIDQQEYEAFLAASGGTAEDLAGGTGNFLPSLRVNYEEDAEDDDAPKLKGKFYISGTDEPVYAKSVRFRPLTHDYQWTQYDDVAKKVTNRTRLIKSFKEEARDEKGTVKCGKPASKDLKANPALAKQYEDITTYRQIQGLVSYTGIDKNGNEVVVPETLVSIRSKGANFSPFDEEFIKLMPAKSTLWEWGIDLTTTREKNGASTYYVIHYTPDFQNKLPLSIAVFGMMKELQANIDKTNKAIDQKYYDAMSNAADLDDAVEAIKEVKANVKSASSGRPGMNRHLDADLSDDIPFN